jgi:drug/metabolite transporter (DMT)-like permease
LGAQPSIKNDRRALLLGLTAIGLWSTVATAFKLALRDLDVLQLLTIATWTSLLVFAGLVAWQGKLGSLLVTFRTAPWYFIGMGVLSPFLYYLILLRAYDLLPAQQAQTINYTWAITLALLAVPLLGHRLGLRDIVAIVLGYTGVVIIATEGQVLSLAFTSLEGVLFALGSTVVWAGFWIAGTRNASDGTVSLCLSFLFAAPLSAVTCLLFSSLPPLSPPVLLPAVYVGLFEMGFTYVIWGAALRAASGVSRVGNLIFLSPMLSLVFIALVLGEPIHPATLVGLALIIPGVLLQQRGRGAAQ